MAEHEVECIDPECKAHGELVRLRAKVLEVEEVAADFPEEYFAPIYHALHRDDKGQNSG